MVFANTDSLPFPVALASQPFEDEGSVSEFGLQLSEGSARSCLLAGSTTFTLHDPREFFNLAENWWKSLMH